MLISSGDSGAEGSMSKTLSWQAKTNPDSEELKSPQVESISMLLALLAPKSSWLPMRTWSAVRTAIVSFTAARSVMSSSKSMTVPAGSVSLGDAAGVALPFTAVSGSPPTPTVESQAASAAVESASKLDSTSVERDRDFTDTYPNSARCDFPKPCATVVYGG